MFRALGDPTRAQIFRFLCGKSGPVAVEASGDVRPISGASVGEVCCHITDCASFSSTIAFHLKELRLAGLIRAERHGKQMVCSADPEAIRELIHHLEACAQAAQETCETL
jgi:DNA-binding transcriptional ArsR family regulator